MVLIIILGSFLVSVFSFSVFKFFQFVSVLCEFQVLNKVFLRKNNSYVILCSNNLFICSFENGVDTLNL